MEASSRMKDYYDIYYLATRENFDGTILKEAIYSTFENRRHLDFIKNIHKLNKFKDFESISSLWNRFIEKEIKISIEDKEQYNKTWNFEELRYI